MAEQDKFYKCEICGNLVSVVEAGPGELVCCEQKMHIMVEHNHDGEGHEKHVPVIEYTEGKVIVKVGSIPHPMEMNHYIEVIQLISPEGFIIGKRLKPHEKPEAEFLNPDNKQNFKARIVCNVHGVWKN